MGVAQRESNGLMPRIGCRHFSRLPPHSSPQDFLDVIGRTGTLRTVAVNSATSPSQKHTSVIFKSAATRTSIAVDGDSLQDIDVMEKVVFVMKGGKINTNRVSGRWRTLFFAELISESWHAIPAFCYQMGRECERRE
jgi:hypothetical protein